MSKRYPRAWKKRYQEKRAAFVADKLLGRKKPRLISVDSGASWGFSTGMNINFYNPSPRSNVYITGITT